MEIQKELNAQEWLKETENDTKELYSLVNYIPTMERYANYKTKELQAQILLYRQRLKKLRDGEEIERMFVVPGEFIMSEILEDYDKHFNIITERNGK